MSPAIQVSLTVLAFCILGGLTVILFAVRSELDLAHERLLGFGLSMTDGPLLGQPLPRRARSLVAAVVAEGRSAKLLLLFVGASCAACQTVLQRIGREGVPDLEGHTLVIAVSGDRSLAEPLVEHLRDRAGVRILLGDEGTRLHEECSMQFTPSVVRVNDGLVYTKGVVSGINTLREAVSWDAPEETVGTSSVSVGQSRS